MSEFLIKVGDEVLLGLLPGLRRQVMLDFFFIWMLLAFSLPVVIHACVKAGVLGYLIARDRYHDYAAAKWQESDKQGDQHDRSGR